MTDTTSTRPQMGDETLSDVKLLEMASDVWIGMARPVTRQSDRWATVLEQHQWLGPFAVALLRAAMSRARSTTGAETAWIIRLRELADAMLEAKTDRHCTGKIFVEFSDVELLKNVASHLEVTTPREKP